ncbi:MAG: mucoidy inhibitor MuiA family protein [Chloroflexota bacterium]
MDYSVETEVTAVTVFPDRARVSCSGKTELATGNHTIVMGDLPLMLEPDSVRAQGAGTAHVRLRSVDVNRRAYAVAPSGRVQELEAALEEQQDALQAITDTRMGAEAMLTHLDNMRGETDQYARGLAKGQTTVEEQARLLAYIQEQDQVFRGQIRELNAQARDIEREIEKLVAELNQLRSARPRQRYEIRLDIEVLKAGEFEPEISYVVGKAGWQPLYDMRFWQPENGKTADAAIKVTYLAQITQNTGQPWNGVRLTVSTARPALNQRLPELVPWFVDEYHAPQPRRYARNAMAKAAGGPEMAVMAEAPMPAAAAMDEMTAAEVVVAEVRGEATAVTFEVGGDVDIPGDGTPQKTVIGQFDLDPEIDYFCAPRHTDAVFRRAKVTNTGPGPLLIGRVNLFAGDEFIGSNSLDYTPVGGELELMLGVEERIEVERKLVRREVDKRLLRDIRQIDYDYEIELRNRMMVPASVEVEDQYPVSRHEQIKVKLDSTSPSPVEQTEMHIIKWRLAVPPEKEQVIRFGYTIEHPRDMKVAGLAD